jgi:hypothetical protein
MASSKNPANPQYIFVHTCFAKKSHLVPSSKYIYEGAAPATLVFCVLACIKIRVHLVCHLKVYDSAKDCRANDDPIPEEPFCYAAIEQNAVTRV